MRTTARIGKKVISDLTVTDHFVIYFTALLMYISVGIALAGGWVGGIMLWFLWDLFNRYCLWRASQ